MYYRSRTFIFSRLPFVRKKSRPKYRNRRLPVTSSPEISISLDITAKQILAGTNSSLPWANCRYVPESSFGFSTRLKIAMCSVPLNEIVRDVLFGRTRESNIRNRGCKYFRTGHGVYLFIFSSRLFAKRQFQPRSVVFTDDAAVSMMYSTKCQKIVLKCLLEK